MLITTRRSFLLGSLAIAGLPAQAATPMVINKDPNCGCCSAWAEHVKGAGFEIRLNDVADLAAIKARLLIPQALASCHTAEIEGYVIEGHVPASAIKRLLSERPSAIGLAVPGMPVGSPGMEVPGSPDETYDVILFGRSGQNVYARFKGARELS